MNWESFSGGVRGVFALMCLVSLCPLAAPTRLLAGPPSFSGGAYCSVPPSAGSGIKPNLLLMLDNSASMYDLAYTDPSSYCVDDSFDSTASYPGYFDDNTVYSYSGTAASGKFVTSSSLLPAGCNAANLDYLCVNLKGSTNRTVDKFFAKGKFLNWLSMSKLDIEKLVLTGGKFQFDANNTSGLLLAETRGCQGRRFVKIAKDAPAVTFAVRGAIKGDSDYLHRTSLGGGSRIEIYDKQYNKDACLKAVEDWQKHAPFQDFNTDALACLCDLTDKPNPYNGLVGPSRGQLYIDIMRNCYLNPADVLGDGTVLNDCRQRAHVRYNDVAANVPSGVGEDVCAPGIDHPFTVHPDGKGDSQGFVGICLSTASSGGSCGEYEAEDYCRSIGNPLVMDPPAGGSLGVPSFILDAGVYSLGSVAATYRVRVASATQPAGVIQEFANEINFGAMIFNSNGAAAECREVGGSTGSLLEGQIPCIKHCLKPGVDTGTECQLDSDCVDFAGATCQSVATADGGKVISPVGSPLGDHKVNSGLVAAIDLVSADAWTPLAESFYNAIGYFAGRTTDLRLQDGDFTTPAPAAFSCQKNNVLLVSDGTSTADRRPEVNTLVANAVRDFSSDPVNPIPPSMTTTGNEPLPAFKGSYNLDDLAWIARNRKITDFSAPPANAREFISSYVVYTGVPCGDYKSDGSCKTTDEGVAEKMMQLTASKGGGRIAYARNSADLEKAFRAMLQSIASGSGTDTSILSSGDGNGAIYLQQQFYPSRSFDGGLTSASWIGELQGLWYYIDPFLGGSAGSGSTIREDSDGDFNLNLKNDRIVNFRQDAGDDQTYAYTAPDSNGDVVADGAEARVVVDQVKSLWRAGQLLWARDLSAQPRSIYAPLLPGGTELPGTGLMKVTAAAATALAPYLNLTSGGLTSAKLINYLQGFDFPSDATIRSRTVTIPSLAGSMTCDPGNTGVGVWKLGDIISSTPQVQSSVALGSYQLPAPSGYGDSTYRAFITSDSYTKKPGMIYVGANDGMLHAFNLGTLNSHGSGDIKAKLAGPDLGKEQWAFVPRNALPYLKYLTEANYQHLYFVDGGLTLVDASIGVSGANCSGDSYWSCPRSWRSILIGGMGLGGASGGATCAPGSSCVATPLADPSRSSSRLGYSSYFALDVTDPNNPVLLWEFSDPALGYSTTGPAIVRIKSPGDGVSTPLNGRWYAVFGSGPTGPIDPVTHQFKGQSQQPLQFFVVDLRTGSRVATITTGIDNASAGQMTGAAIDVGRAKGSYQDDAIYVGYTTAAGSTWTDGGVVRILTKTNDTSNELNDPNQWSASPLISGIGPVTAAVAKLQDRKKHALWLYFGTGRYFYGQDDMATRRALYGVKEPCYNAGNDEMDTQCSRGVTPSALSDQTTVQDIPVGAPGWIIQLDRAAGTAGAERVVSKPVSSTSGAVYFTSFEPSTDPCIFGGSYLWGVQYDSGGAIAAAMQGKALVQLDTGSMQDTGLSGGLSANQGRRTTVPMTGRPGGLKIVSNSGLKPLKKIIHIQER
jgi:type IV pilus assembly protein PilY1